MFVTVPRFFVFLSISLFFSIRLIRRRLLWSSAELNKSIVLFERHLSFSTTLYIFHSWDSSECKRFTWIHRSQSHLMITLTEPLQQFDINIDIPIYFLFVSVVNVYKNRQSLRQQTEIHALISWDALIELNNWRCYEYALIMIIIRIIWMCMGV